MATTSIVLWNREPVYESPARKTFSVNWDGDLRRADLSVDVDPNFLLLFGKHYLEKIVVNGTEVQFQGDRNDVVSADLRSVLRKGVNVIELYHNALPVWGIQTAGVYAYLVVESSGQVAGEPPVSGGDGGSGGLPGFQIPWWFWLLIGLVVLVVVLRR